MYEETQNLISVILVILNRKHSSLSVCGIKMASANSKAMSLSPPKSVPFGKIDEDGGNTLSPLSSNPNSRKNSTIHQFHPPVQHHIVPTEKCGLLNVYVQGDLAEAHPESKNPKCVFLTVHDIGTNHSEWEAMTEHKKFEEIKYRAIFIHVDLPGQEDNAKDFPSDFQFPTIQSLAEDLVTVLNQLGVTYCIGLGDGAGANIILRYGLIHESRCLGVILLNPTANKGTMLEILKQKFSEWKIDDMIPKVTDEQRFAFRKYGHKLDALDNSMDIANALEEFTKSLLIKKTINKDNLKKFMDSYVNRTDITQDLSTDLLCDALLVVGSKSLICNSALELHSKMHKTRTSLLKVDGIGNVVEEAPATLANSFLLFCKGVGCLESVKLLDMGRRRSSYIFV